MLNTFTLFIKGIAIEKILPSFILLFTLLAYRSWRYTLIILLATIGNTLICFAIYVVCNITIHIYALVGVTIAMGIAIGFYTIAIDHYNNRKKSTWFLLTTVYKKSIMALTNFTRGYCYETQPFKARQDMFSRR